jgi:hypothetical protein
MEVVMKTLIDAKLAEQAAWDAFIVAEANVRAAERDGTPLEILRARFRRLVAARRIDHAVAAVDAIVGRGEQETAA